MAAVNAAKSSSPIFQAHPLHPHQETDGAPVVPIRILRETVDEGQRVCEE